MQPIHSYLSTPGEDVEVNPDFAGRLGNSRRGHSPSNAITITEFNLGQQRLNFEGTSGA